ncbi:DUF4840 domain-containing protein [Prevotella sp. oral taxon 376]|uniref:DUF4840 domain-containing protein n=1 Tax=Prevotella sp. oral taxon 376 TaxID=712466 RepID=UPI000D1FA5B6|nr:DUF4840 domain-containing protein [Prevotella sp. oral taxon 376]PTL33735.1 DUF4840 domain-containing protein [Prevotella sp. oral taxon 376]
MKKLKFFSVMLCCMAAMFLTSCNTDDNGYTLTKEEIAACLNAVKGNYTGKLIYPSQNPNNSNDKTDSLDIQWSADMDTTITVKQFPASLLAKFVEDNTLKTALESAENKELKCNLYFTRVSPVVFLANTAPIELSLNYGGAAHQVQVLFYINSAASVGIYDASKKELQIQLLIGNISVDKGQTNYLKNPTPLVFSGTK